MTEGTEEPPEGTEEPPEKEKSAAKPPRKPAPKADPEGADLISFHKDLHQEIIARSEVHEDGVLREEEFTQIFIDYLSDIGEVDDAFVAHHQARGLKASAYYVSEDGDRLDLFISEPNLVGSLESVTKTEINTAFKRLRAFLDKALNGYHESLEEASDGFDMAWSVSETQKNLLSVRLFLLTDGLTKIEAIEDTSINGVEISHHVWDLRRLYRAAISGTGQEAIQVDFRDSIGHPLDCLEVPRTSDKYRCFLGVLTGQMVIDLYTRFGPRLLERNVRSFLQLRGNVNKGIRDTLQEEPEMFAAYNNGLSIIVRGVEGEASKGGQYKIFRTEDFQIVNGGQTTGSVFRASRKGELDISKVFIPVKITEISSDEFVDEVSPKISLYANSQNKVNAADFSSNHPFHVKLEELSRTTWAEPRKGMQKQTRWFYERARGQYLDEKSRQETGAKRKAWEVMHPRQQMITKTDLGKFENTWSQLPHIVSRGAQKSFLHFMDLLDKRGGVTVDDVYFHRLIAKSILFKEAVRIVTKQKYGGYRAEIVTYTLSWINHSTAQRIDLERIWQDQGLLEELENTIRDVSKAVHEHIVNAPGGQNIREWCKKDACWDKFREKKIISDHDLSGILLKGKGTRPKKPVHTVDEATPEEEKIISKMAAVSEEVWFGISTWAKETQNLLPWQRGISFSLGKIVSQGKSPSRKQAVQGEKILKEAQRLGFRIDGPETGDG